MVTYQGSIARFQGLEVVASRIERTVDDGSLLGFDFLEVILEGGHRLRNVRESSLRRG